MARPALAATRAVAVLNLMAARPTEVFSLSELAQRLGINNASAHAVMAVLQDSGYVTRHPRHKTYALGPAAVALGHAALERHTAIDVARDEMRRLAGELDLEVLLVAKVADEMVAVARAGRRAGTGANMRVGQRVPIQPPLGSAFIAWEDDDTIAAWLARAAPDTPASELASQRAALAAVRERGYSVGLDLEEGARLGELLAVAAEAPQTAHLQESLQGAISELGHAGYPLDATEAGQSYRIAVIMAPIFDAEGHVGMILSMTGHRDPQSADDVRRHGEQLRAAGLRITRATHGRIPD
ncbi:MAG: helix-turn-helix domain-containing protein [Proteobacteria bacterium]|nr:helix-turn-helix domain-containing protein [Pseudomonadota bacterium]